VLGPSTQKQADKSREAIQEVGEGSFDASDNVHDGTDSGTQFGHTDGGRSDLDKNNGVDVVRTE
jgi:cell division protein FtsZ